MPKEYTIRVARLECQENGMKKTLITLHSVPVLPGISCAKTRRTEIAENPNFIILFTDDQRYDAPGYTVKNKIIFIT